MKLMNKYKINLNSKNNVISKINYIKPVKSIIKLLIIIIFWLTSKL